MPQFTAYQQTQMLAVKALRAHTLQLDLRSNAGLSSHMLMCFQVDWGLKGQR